MANSQGEFSPDSSFWRHYEDCLLNNGIKADSFRWYVIWCLQFIKFIGHISVRDCQPEHVSAFLDNIQQRPKLSEWQYRQARSALWHLFRDCLQVAWAVNPAPVPGRVGHLRRRRKVDRRSRLHFPKPISRCWSGCGLSCVVDSMPNER